MSRILNDFIQIELLLLEHRLLAVKHTHLQHLFYQETESLRFIIYHTTQMLLHLLALGNRWVVEHLCRQTDAGNRRLQLMGHIVDEVILDLRISLLSEDDHDGEDKGDEQYQRKDDTRNHEAHTGEDVAVHIWEVNLYDSHLRLRVVAEEYLRIAVFLTLVGIIRATVHLPAILGCYRKVIRDIDSIVHHLCLEILIQLLEVDSFLQWFIGCRVENGINHFVEQRFLIHIAILHNLLQGLLSLIKRVLVAAQNHRLRLVGRIGCNGLQLEG